MWSDSLDAIPDYALTGSGLSTYRYVFPIYRSSGGRIFYSWAHNDYLQLLIELGLPGFLLLLWLMIAVWGQAMRVRKTLRDDPALLPFRRLRRDVTGCREQEQGQGPEPRERAPGEEPTPGQTPSEE